jgi:hypothetical protein
MEYSEFKILIKSKSLGRLTANFDDEILPMQIETGIKFIAMRTVVLRLVTQSNTTVSVLRKLDDETFIRTPNKPTEAGSVIDIDDALLDALALYVIAGYERQQAKVHMGMCHAEIDANNVRLIETEQGDDDGCYLNPNFYEMYSTGVDTSEDWYE